MNWWCSSTGRNWTWTFQPYIGSSAIVVALVGVAVWWSARGRHQEVDLEPPTSEGRAQMPVHPDVVPGRVGTPRGRTFSFVLGVIGLWFVLDWPLAALGAGYLATAQMARQVLMVMAVAPLLLFACPPELAVRAVGWGRRLAVLRWATRPRVTVPVAALVLIGMNTPAVADPLFQTQYGMFLMDASWVFAGFMLWMPVQCPHPGVRRLTGATALMYLIGQSVVPVLPGFFMTWADFPLYATYELAPRVVEGFDPITDQQTAAAILQVGGMVLLWLQIGYRFIAWANDHVNTDRANSITPAAH